MSFTAAIRLRLALKSVCFSLIKLNVYGCLFSTERRRRCIAGQCYLLWRALRIFISSWARTWKAFTVSPYMVNGVEERLPSTHRSIWLDDSTIYSFRGDGPTIRRDSHTVGLSFPLHFSRKCLLLCLILASLWSFAKIPDGRLENFCKVTLH